MKERRNGIILNYATMLLKLIIGLIYTPFLLSKIGDSQYGILSLANSFIVFVTILDCGFGQTLIRYQTQNKVNQDTKREASINGLFLKLYILVSFIAILLGVAITIFYPMISHSTLSSEEIILFREVFFILLVNTVLTFPLRLFSADLQVYERFAFFKGINLLLLIFRYLTMALLLILGFKVVAMAVVISATSLVTQLLYMLYCLKNLSFKISFDGVEQTLKQEILTFSFFILINLIVDFLYDNTDKLLLGAIKGTVAVTVYSVGITFYSYFKLLSTSISGVYMPKIVAEYEKGNDMTVISDMFYKIGKLQLYVLMLVLNLFILFGKQFLELWVGSGYEDAYIVGLLIMVPSVIPLSQNLGQSILRAMNLHRYRSYMYLTIAILNITMTIPFAMQKGPIGAALATCIATILGEIIFLNWFYAKKAGISIKTYWIFFMKLLLACLTLDLIVSFIIAQISLAIWTWLILIGFITVFSIIYTVIFLFALTTKAERAEVIQNLKRQ